MLCRHLDFVSREAKLTQSLRSLASTMYDKSNPAHEELLLNLWKLLCPNRPLSNRISSDWGDIGFQGTDPATDFRGMGLLGLLQLLEFGRFDSGDPARGALSLANHPSYGFPFSCACINITAWLLQSLEQGKLRIWFASRNNISSETFHFLYITLFDKFAHFYVASRPEDIMSFGVLFGQFKEDIERTRFLFDTRLPFHGLASDANLSP